MSNEKNASDSTNKKKRKIVLAVLIIAFLLCIAAFYAVPTIISSGRKNVTGDDFNSYAGSQDEAVVFTADNAEITSIKTMSDRCIALCGNSLVTMKKGGAVADVSKTGFSSAVAKFSDKNYVVFERSTGKLLIMDKNGTVHSTKYDDEIINAAVSSSGNYIVITRKTLVSSLVSVYSPKHEMLFCWECNDGYLTDCAISPNGKKIAVVLFDVVDGNESSKILTFTTKSADIEKEFDGASIVYGLKFINNNEIGIVTNRSYSVVDFQSGEKKTADYEYDSVSSYSFGKNNYIAVLKEDFGSLARDTISVYDRSAAQVFTKEIEDEVIDFCIDKSFVYVLTSCKITMYAISSGEEYKSFEVAGGLKHICTVSGGIFCSSAEEIYKYDR